MDNYDGSVLVEDADPPLVLTVTVFNIAAARKGWHGWIREGDIDRLTGEDVTVVLLDDWHKGWRSVAGVLWAKTRDGAITATFMGRSGWERPKS
jgi:hypothetical protein